MGKRGMLAKFYFMPPCARLDRMPLGSANLHTVWRALQCDLLPPTTMAWLLAGKDGMNMAEYTAQFAVWSVMVFFDSGLASSPAFLSWRL